jgi:hypothetical protein
MMIPIATETHRIARVLDVEACHNDVLHVAVQLGTLEHLALDIRAPSKHNGLHRHSD